MARRLHRDAGMESPALLRTRTFAAFLVVAVAVAVAALAACGLNEVRTQGRTSAPKIISPDGNRVAQIRPRAAGGDVLYVNDALVWPKEADRTATVTVSPRWAHQSDAIAFLARERQMTRLVVVLVSGDAAGQVLEWAVPRAALPAKVITWMDARRVSVGEREMAPKMVASWDAPS